VEYHRVVLAAHQQRNRFLNPRRAIVDIGSNSVLLLVSELRDGVWTPIIDKSEVTALGAGVRESHQLGEAGMEATLGALKRAFQKASELGAEAMAFGTMSLRLAENTPTFQTLAAAQGTPVEVLSGEDEAKLGWAAVVEDPTFAESAEISVIDIGGQSTEISTDSGPVSYAIGTLGIRTTETLSETDVAELEDEIRKVFAIVPTHPSSTCVCLGATGTNLISIREAMPEWRPDLVHGATLARAEVADFVAKSCAMTDAQRAALPGIEPGRERTIHLGALILAGGLDALHVDACRVSVRGWRHALLERL
jgi:exopolyphosphatase/guanosine-5'-triphosphate,3'-diphosphate pyrophosphatase